MGEVIALIGMDLLGSALAETLIAAGFTVRGYDVAPDRRREHAARGGIAARSSVDAARGASVVVTCLMTADLVREVLLGPDGALETAAPGTVVIDASTIHPDASAALARDLAARGIAMLDAPVGGSSGQARRREAPVVVGGEPAIFDWPWPRDSCSGSARGWTARPCSPSSKDSGAYSRAMDLKGERMLEGNFEPEGKLAQHLKDVELMLEVGHAAGAPLMATALHRQLLRAGVAGGFGERDNSSIIEVLRSLLGEPR